MKPWVVFNPSLEKEVFIVKYSKNSRITSIVLVCTLFSQSTIGFAQDKLGPSTSPQVSSQASTSESPSDAVSILFPEEELERLSHECQLRKPPSPSLEERCSQGAINVLGSYTFNLCQITFFLSWVIYNALSPEPFDPGPVFAGMGTENTFSAEILGSVDVMAQKLTTNDQVWRAGLQKEVIEQTSDLFKKWKDHQLDPSRGSDALNRSLESSKKLLTELGFFPSDAPSGTNWEEHWDRAIQNREKSAHLRDQVTDFLSQNIRSPQYLLLLTTILATWFIYNSVQSESFDPFPFPILNTALCMATDLQASFIIQVMKRRAAEEKNKDVATELLDIRHLIQIIKKAEAQSAVGAGNIPTLDQIPASSASDPSTFLNRGARGINRTISSYPYIISSLVLAGAWATFNATAPDNYRIDPAPYPALNIFNAVAQEYYSSFEVAAQNSSVIEESRLARLHQTLLDKTLKLTHLLSPGVDPSIEELKAKILEVQSSLKEHGLPDKVSDMEDFYKRVTAEHKLGKDSVTDFAARNLRNWRYVGALTFLLAGWATANSLAPGAIDPYPFSYINIVLTIWSTIQESFVIRIMLRQNDIGTKRRENLYLLDAIKLTELLEMAERVATP
jgi:uncharacterized membrane protein